MTGEEQRRLGLFVLLSSSGCLGLPRYSEDGDGGDDDDDGTTQTVDEGPQGPDVTGPSPTSSNDDDVASFVFEADVGPITSPTTSPTTVADVSGDPSDTDGPVPEACFAYGNKVAECYDDRSGMVATGYCIETFELYTEYYGPECGFAFEDFVACLSALSCEDFIGGSDVPCQAELAKMEEICTS